MITLGLDGIAFVSSPTGKRNSARAGPTLVVAASLELSEFSPPAHGELPRMHVLSA